MAASFPLPVTQDLSTLRAKLQGLLRFLREALSISNAHTVDFYTESVWEQLIDLPPETVLAVLRRSTEEAEAQPWEARPLVEAERGSGEWRVGGADGEAGPSVLSSGIRAESGEGQGGSGGPWRFAFAGSRGGDQVSGGMVCGRSSGIPRLSLGAVYLRNLNTRNKARRSFI